MKNMLDSWLIANGNRNAKIVGDESIKIEQLHGIIMINTTATSRRDPTL